MILHKRLSEFLQVLDAVIRMGSHIGIGLGDVSSIVDSLMDKVRSGDLGGAASIIFSESDKIKSRLIGLAMLNRIITLIMLSLTVGGMILSLYLIQGVGDATLTGMILVGVGILFSSFFTPLRYSTILHLATGIILILSYIMAVYHGVRTSIGIPLYGSLLMSSPLIYWAMRKDVS